MDMFELTHSSLNNTTGRDTVSAEWICRLFALVCRVVADVLQNWPTLRYIVAAEQELISQKTIVKVIQKRCKETLWQRSTFRVPHLFRYLLLRNLLVNSLFSWESLASSPFHYCNTMYRIPSLTPYILYSRCSNSLAQFFRARKYHPSQLYKIWSILWQRRICYIYYWIYESQSMFTLVLFASSSISNLSWN